MRARRDCADRAFLSRSPLPSHPTPLYDLMEVDILLPTPSPTPPLPLDGQLSRVRDLHRARQTGIVLPLLPAPDVESADTTPPAVIKLRSQRPPNILIVKRRC